MAIVSPDRVRLAASDGDLSTAHINTTAAGDLLLVAAAPAQITRVYRLWLWVGGATILTFKRGASALGGPVNVPATGAFIALDFGSEPWFVTNPNEAFTINSSAAVQLSGMAYYSRR